MCNARHIHFYPVVALTDVVPTVAPPRATGRPPLPMLDLGKILRAQLGYVASKSILFFRIDNGIIYLHLLLAFAKKEQPEFEM